jgi:hypothetical protein
MHRDEHTSTTTVWTSDVRPEIGTTEPPLAEVIAWADAHPCAWDVVTRARSKAFGLGSCEYIGWAQRGMAPTAVLERARHLHGLAEGRDAFQGPASIFAWRARFTLEHYRDKGFTGGSFRQHDGQFHRLCMTMDYTPETLGDVVTRFIAWCGRDCRTEYVTLDSKVVRRMDRST